MDSLQRARSTRSRALILANPANPTGAVHEPALLRDIATWCADNNIWLICDEIYNGFVYDGPLATDNVVRNNTFEDNTLDLQVATAGAGNVVTDNDCTTSDPNGLC